MRWYTSWLSASASWCKQAQMPLNLPCCMWQGVGEHIAACSAPKIFLINGSHDRETTVLPSALEDLPHFCSATAREDSWASTHDSMQQPIEPDHHTGTATHRFSADSAQLAGSTPPDPELDRGPNDDAHADGATSAAGSSRHRGDSKATGRQSQAPAYNPGGTLQAEPPEPTSNAATDGSEDVGSPAHRFRQLTLNTTEAHGPPQMYKPQNNVRYMKASDMVLAICDALNRTHAPTANRPLSHAPEAYVTALIAPQRGEVQVDSEMLRQLGIRHVLQRFRLTLCVARYLELHRKMWTILHARLQQICLCADRYEWQCQSEHMLL